MRIATLVFVLSIVLVTVELCEAASRRRSSSSGSRRRSGSSSPSSGSRRRSSSRSKGSSGSSSKQKITKYTPIKPTSVRSPVIVSQTKQGLRSSTVKKVVVGYLVYHYVLSRAPVYRQGYPMYRSYVSIPKDRAVRLSYEEEKMLDDEGRLCLGTSEKTQKLREGIDEELVELNTTVKYSNGKTMQRYGIDNTVSLADIQDEEFEVTSRARYNTSIVAGTNCTQVQKTVNGTMVTMYETNPNGSSQMDINNKLLLTVISMIAFFHKFRY